MIKLLSANLLINSGNKLGNPDHLNNIRYIIFDNFK